MDNLPHLLALHSVDGFGPIRLKRIIDHFEDPKLAWDSSIKEFKGMGIPQNILEKFNEKRKTLDPENYYQQILKQGVKVSTIFDTTYPKRLKQIYDPPLIIFFKGSIDNLDRTFGIVGTRKVTSYGRIVTKQLTEGLVDIGFTIISGLARGVDTIAHQTTVDLNGKTIAVLGGGVNSIFPPENTRLAHEIVEKGGAYLSEYPPDYPHLAGNFPSRNRIISGLSIAVLVTEAAEDSGSLITAHQALDQGKEVFAVPGPITSSLSKGPAQLIKNGAKLVFNLDDILEELGIDQVQNSKLKVQSNLNLTDHEKKILECLENEQKHIDELCRELKKQISEVSGTLIKLEILGLIKNLGSGNYIKSL